MKNLLKTKNFYFVLFTDFIIIILSFYASYLIRFEFNIPEIHFNEFLKALPLIIFIKMICFFYFHLYQGMWRYTSLFDIFNIVKAVAVSSVTIIIMILWIHHFIGYPRSVFIIDSGLTLIFVAGTRGGLRLYYAKTSGVDIFPIIFRRKLGGKKLLIIGAGSTGEKVIREIQGNPGLNIVPLGFLDDNPEKRGKTIHGVEVIGTVDQMANFVHLFDEILIAAPRTDGQKMRKMVSLCKATGKKFLTIPAMGELIDGKISIKTARNVTLQDLLGREEINLNKDSISVFLKNKKILITGAGGSIGKELVRQVARFHPRSIALIDMSELNLFRVEMECNQHFAYIDIRAYLVDIREYNAISRVFQIIKPDVVFHAAAYKHVPMQEMNPWEAVKNNVMGTRNLVQLSNINKVDKFVLVSTDKAVRPTNVMGATKRIAEMLTACTNTVSPSKYISVRFGNVVGSSGSVIPIFREQIERGGPVTITHPEVTRYFMSIPESAQLILEAGAMGEGGEIFILDMGNPVKIVEMARDLIRLHGYEPDRDIAIQYIGLRPGEKLYEELITQGEGIVKTNHKKIMVLKGSLCNLKSLNKDINELIEVANSFNRDEIRKKINEIVPEYKAE